MKQILLLGSIFAILATGCTTRQITPTRRMEIAPSAVYSKVKIADYYADFSKKIDGVSSGKIKPPHTVEFFKDQAMADACQKNRCDFLVNPTFDVIITNNQANVTVTGYAAAYVELRDITPEDSIHIQMSQPRQQNIPNIVNKQKKPIK